MIKTIPALLASAALALTPIAASAQSELDWTYADGSSAERWDDANIDYAPCGKGAMQSPIDLSEANAFGDIEIAASYGMGEGTLKLGTHKVQVDAPAGMGMISGDMLFNFIQVHFHTPSEHEVNGQRYPLAAHFVHATGDGVLGVLGMKFQEGEPNPALQAIIDAMASGSGSKLTLDFSDMVPDDLEVYRYQGSLTTPPCSENVNWHVVDEVLEASSDQIAAFEQALGFSARSLQPRNNRLVVAPGD